MELSSDNLKEIRKKDNCIIFEYNSKEDAWLAYEQGFENTLDKVLSKAEDLSKPAEKAALPK